MASAVISVNELIKLSAAAGHSLKIITQRGCAMCNCEAACVSLSPLLWLCRRPSPKKRVRASAKPLQQAVYSKRIISPIPWCHCKATEALPHGEPLLQPLLATLSLSSPACERRPSRPGNHFSGSKHFPFGPEMTGASAQAQTLVSFFSYLTVRTTDKLPTGNKRPYAEWRGHILYSSGSDSFFGCSEFSPGNNNFVMFILLTPQYTFFILPRKNKK